jgi:hypothetical protein
MVIVASIYLRFYMEVEVGVRTFLPTPTPPKIPSDSDSDSTALLQTVTNVSFMCTKFVKQTLN